MNAFSDPPQPESRPGAAVAFREAREEAGLSQRELATLLGTSCGAIDDLEKNDDELFRRYSLKELGLMAEVLGVNAARLLGSATDEPPLFVPELIEQIHRQLEASPDSVGEFEKQTGWRMREFLESPDLLPADLTVDGLQRLCAAVAADWRRVLAGLGMAGRSGD